MTNGLMLGQQQNIHLDLGENDRISCKCGAFNFDQAYHVFRVPKLAPIPNAGGIVQLPVFICRNCGELLLKEALDETGPDANKPS